MHHFASTDRSMCSFIGKSSNNDKHKECGESRMKIDFADFKLMKQWLEDHDPFFITTSNMEIKSLTTGLTSLPITDINCDRAFEIGNYIQSSIDGMSYNEAIIKASQKVKSLVTLENTIKAGGRNVHMDNTIILPTHSFDTKGTKYRLSV